MEQQKLSQLHLIDRTIVIVSEIPDTTLAGVSTINDVVVHKDQSGAPRKQELNFCHTICILNFYNLYTKLFMSFN